MQRLGFYFTGIHSRPLACFPLFGFNKWRVFKLFILVPLPCGDTFTAAMHTTPSSSHTPSCIFYCCTSCFLLIISANSSFLYLSSSLLSLVTRVSYTHERECCKRAGDTDNIKSCSACIVSVQMLYDQHMRGGVMPARITTEANFQVCLWLRIRCF